MNNVWIKKIGTCLFMLSLVAVHVLFRSTAHAETPDSWKQFFTQDGKCSIFFPDQPILVQQSLRIADGQVLDYDIYLAPFEDKGVFMLLVATYPPTLPRGHEIAGLEGL